MTTLQKEGLGENDRLKQLQMVSNPHVIYLMLIYFCKNLCINWRVVTRSAGSWRIGPNFGPTAQAEEAALKLKFLQDNVE